MTGVEAIHDLRLFVEDVSTRLNAGGGGRAGPYGGRVEPAIQVSTRRFRAGAAGASAGGFCLTGERGLLKFGGGVRPAQQGTVRCAVQPVNGGGGRIIEKRGGLPTRGGPAEVTKRLPGRWTAAWDDPLH